MAVIRWDPFTALARLDSDFDDLMRRTWGSGGTPRPSAGYVPAVEMVRDGADVVITCELPGLDVEKDVDIEVSGGRLAVSGERREMVTYGGADASPDDQPNASPDDQPNASPDDQPNASPDDQRSSGTADRVMVRELHYGSFRREFVLPEHVTAEDFEASYDCGLLTVRVRNVTRPVAAPTKIAVRRAPEQVAVETGTSAEDRSG